MKNGLFRSIILLAFTSFLFINEGFGQCTPANTNVSNTTAATGVLGQSFLATCTGKLNTIKVVGSAPPVSNFSVSIYSGTAPVGVALATITNQSTKLAATFTDYSVFDFSASEITLTSGQSYSFKINSTAHLLYDQSATAAYPDGQFFFNGAAQSTLDLLFEVDIVAGVTVPTSAEVAPIAFLEGAYNGTSLHTSLNASIPTAQPYSGTAFNNHNIGESSAVPAGAVDWVLVELREAGSAATALNSTKVGSAAGFLMSDGSIKATNGSSNLIVSLSGNSGADFFIVIYHRNHLPIMSANAISESGGTYSIDFTSASANTYQTTAALASLTGGKFGLPAGDTDGDGGIDTTDLGMWRTNNGAVFGYGSNGAADFNLDGVINAVDRNDFYRKNTSKTRQVPTT